LPAITHLLLEFVHWLYPLDHRLALFATIVFFNAYRGSGLVIQCLARFHATPIRLKARRIDSTLKAREVTPCSKQTSASRRSIHRLVGLPNERGLSCTIARSRSRLASSRRVRHFWGEMIWLARGRHVGSVRTNRVAHGLCCTSDVRRDLGGTLAASAGKQDLAAS
jgi:hypothetical protein